MEEKKQEKRQPIVVILGHVDHGKTTLLDVIRETNVQGKEAGGITQKIGASVVTFESVAGQNKSICFIDTPGHAAFSSMRARGAKTADIAVLVVAANDSVKPQTKEALEYILNAKLPFIVAATKMDLPAVSLDNVKSDLTKEGVMFEDVGGDVPLVPISARNKTGIKELLEMISLVADLNDIKGGRGGEFEAKVIETSKEKMGPSVSLVVRSGVLRVGDDLISENGEAKVRGVFDSVGKTVKEVFPGEPAQVLGFTELPEVGSTLWKKSEKEILPVISKKTAMTRTSNSDEGKLKLVIKAKNTGSLEAIISGIAKEAEVILSSVGDIIDSDIFMAKSAGARIFAFESKVSGNASRLADTEGVKIEVFNIIYRLFGRVDEILKGKEEVILGSAMIIASFPYEGKRVAGCKILTGQIGKKDVLTLKRDEKVISEVKIASLKKGKMDVETVKQGEECGIFIYPQLDFKEGDVLISERKQV
jgi:translation initiation factor IF-2